MICRASRQRTQINELATICDLIVGQAAAGQIVHGRSKRFACASTSTQRTLAFVLAVTC